MNHQQNHLRIKSLFKMLLEMATGNIAFRVQLNGNGDEIDKLAAKLNEVADKMEKLIARNENKKLLPNYNKHLQNAKQADKELIQKVLDYIKNNLEEPLPTTRELSKMFGTNEFTLKDNFRNIVKTSIYQFYNDERLKKSYFLIKETSIPLKEIAILCGFNDYPNFYKAFKKKFKQTPSKVITNDLRNNQL